MDHIEGFTSIEESSGILADVEQVTAEWLTNVLIRSGALTQGRVAGFEVHQGGGNWSTNAILNLQYVGAQGTNPRRLFLKMVNADQEDEFFGPSEVNFYQRDYLDLESAPLLRCYDAAYSQKLRRYHLLLDDVSITHVEAAEKEPSLEYGLALAEGLAVLHAHWWDARRLEEAGAPIHSPEHIQRFVDIAEPGADHIRKAFAADLKPHWPEVIRRLFADHPRAIIDRTQDANGFTLIHGDAGHNNILVPRHGTRPIYLIDRQPFDWSLTTWLGVYDLAYAMVLDWEIDTRRRLEMQVLKHYHENLTDRGVVGYSWERLLDDYRLSVAMGVYIATEYCRGGVNVRWLPVWLPMLKRALTACDDLKINELWSRRPVEETNEPDRCH